MSAAASPVACAPASYALATQTKCSACPAGHFCASSANAPQACVAGSYALSNWGFCVVCPAGHACNTTTNARSPARASPFPFWRMSERGGDALLVTSALSLYRSAGAVAVRRGLGGFGGLGVVRVVPARPLREHERLAAVRRVPRRPQRPAHTASRRVYAICREFGRWGFFRVGVDWCVSCRMETIFLRVLWKATGASAPRVLLEGYAARDKS